ncbi:MAG: hypothetical protein JSR32_06980 [Proteobacteria bacterium]|jgi:hypothetical protein|nr:hypothetical protein [Pseudomonadota bacterium]
MGDSAVNQRHRRILQAAGASFLFSKTGVLAETSGGTSMQNLKAQLILRNGQSTTLDRQYPQATVVAIAEDRFIAVRNNGEVRPA